MASGTQNYYQIGGINRKLNPFLVKPSEMRMVRNYVSDIFYTKEKRGGYKFFLDNPDASQVYNLVHFKRNDGQRCVLRISGTSIYKYSFTGDTWGAAVKTDWGSVADQRQIMNDTTDVNAQLNATTDRAAQGFKVSTTTTYPYIQLLIKKFGSPGTLTVALQTDNAGKPSGSTVTNGSLTITAAECSTTPSWVYKSFATAPTLTAGTQYWIVLSAAATVNATNYYEFRNATNNVYADGSFSYSANSGTAWSASTVGDMAFILYRRGGVVSDTTILSNKLIIGNGGDQTVYYDQSAFTTLTEAPIAKYWTNIYGRAVAAGLDISPSAIYGSKTEDPTSWINDASDPSSGWTALVDPDNNGAITGIEKKAGRIIVHKEGGLYKIIFDEYGVPQEIIDMENGASTLSNASIISSGEYNYYLSETGVFRGQGSNPDIVSLPLADLFDNITYANGVASVAGAIGDFIHWSVGNITEDDVFGGRAYTNCAITYNKRTEEWTLDTLAHAPTTYATFRNASNVLQLFFGNSAGNTFVFDGSTTDGVTLAGADGTPIDGELRWTPNAFGDPAAIKTYGAVFFRSEPGVGAEVAVIADHYDAVSIGSLHKGFVDAVIPDTLQNTRELEVTIYDTSRRSVSRVYGYSIEVEPTTRRTDI